MEGSRKRGIEDGKKAGQEDETDINYGKMDGRKGWKIGGMEGRRKRGMESWKTGGRKGQKGRRI
jgi:hypothetical protein